MTAIKLSLLPDAPITEAINRLIEQRTTITSMPQWWSLPQWERNAIWDYARQMGRRYTRLFGDKG